MSQNSLGRIWNRIVDRYEKDDGSDCCGTIVEEDPPEPPEVESKHCCE